MKTFKEFLDEAYLTEMRKQDKVKGKEKTPLNVTTRSASVGRAPEGSGKKWQVNKYERTTQTGEAAIGRYMQGMSGLASSGAETGGASGTYKRHPHGGGGYGAKAPGRLRGVGKLAQQKLEKTPEGERKRPFNAGPSPAEKVRLKRAIRASKINTGKRL